MALDSRNPLGGGSERVAAIRHRGRSGVPCGAGEYRLGARLSHDALDDAKWKTQPFEDGALLDVELEVADKGSTCGGVRKGGGVEAEGTDPVSDHPAVAVAT